MKNIVIVGAGGFGRELAWLIEDINRVNNEWNLLGFVDDNKKVNELVYSGYTVLGDLEWLKKQAIYVVFGIADPVEKKKAIERLGKTNNEFPVLIHPNVIHSNSIDIGEGTIICASNILTVDIKIGKHVILNLDCTVGHDAVIKNFTTIYPAVNVSGYVTIEECGSIGTGSAIIQGLTVGANTIVGAGSVVVDDLPDNCTAVGAPARPIKFH